MILLHPLQFFTHILYLQNMLLFQSIDLCPSLVIAILQFYHIGSLHPAHLFQLGLLVFAHFRQHSILIFVVLKQHLGCLAVRRHLHLLHVYLLTIYAFLVVDGWLPKSLFHIIIIHYHSIKITDPCGSTRKFARN